LQGNISVAERLLVYQQNFVNLIQGCEKFFLSRENLKFMGARRAIWYNFAIQITQILWAAVRKVDTSTWLLVFAHPWFS